MTMHAPTSPDDELFAEGADETAGAAPHRLAESPIDASARSPPGP